MHGVKPDPLHPEGVLGGVDTGAALVPVETLECPGGASQAGQHTAGALPAQGNHSTVSFQFTCMLFRGIHFEKKSIFFDAIYLKYASMSSDVSVRNIDVF